MTYMPISVSKLFLRPLFTLDLRNSPLSPEIRTGAVLLGPISPLLSVFIKILSIKNVDVGDFMEIRIFIQLLLTFAYARKYDLTSE